MRLCSKNTVRPPLHKDYEDPFGASLLSGFVGTGFVGTGFMGSGVVCDVLGGGGNVSRIV